MKHSLMAVVIALGIGSHPLLAADVGDPAPQLNIAVWVNGVGVAEFGSTEDVQLLCFWSTWSRPSIDALPALAKELSTESSVVLVAIANEPTEDVSAAMLSLESVDGIHVAIDQNKATFSAYLYDHDRQALPHAFVIARDGTIAWHGHPNDAAEVATAVLAGSYEPVAVQEERPQRRRRLRRRDLEPQERPQPADEPASSMDTLTERFGQAMDDGKWDEAIRLLDQMAGLFPKDADESQILAIRKFQLLSDGVGDAARTAAFAETLLNERKDQETVMNHVAWTLLAEGTFETLEGRLPHVAHAAAHHAMRACEAGNPAIVDTYARSLYLLGHIDNARDWQAKAVFTVKNQLIAAESGSSDEDTITNIRLHLRQLEQSQDYYNEIAVVRAGADIMRP